MQLLLAALGVVTIGAALPFTPLAHLLGFQPLPGAFFLALAGLVIAYLALIELGKYLFYRYGSPAATLKLRHRVTGHRVHRRAARFTTHTLRPTLRTRSGPVTFGPCRSGCEGQEHRSPEGEVPHASAV